METDAIEAALSSWEYSIDEGHAKGDASEARAQLAEILEARRSMQDDIAEAYRKLNSVAMEIREAPEVVRACERQARGILCKHLGNPEPKRLRPVRPATRGRLEARMRTLHV